MATRIGRLALYFGTLMAVETPIMLHFRGNMNGFAILWMLLGVVIHFLVFVGIGSIVGGLSQQVFRAGIQYALSQSGRQRCAEDAAQAQEHEA